MPPDAPAEHAQAVDHGRVRVGADQRVGVERCGRWLPACRVVGEDDAGQVFEIDLVDDAGLGRHDAEVAERLLAPAQEDVALVVAGIFQVGVGAEGQAAAEVVDLDRVVDDQLDRLERVDRPGSPPMRFMASRMAARSTTAGTPVKSCSSTRLGVKAISLARLGLGLPGGQGGDVFGLDGHGRPRCAAGFPGGS